MNQKLEVHDIEVRLVLEAIHERYGYDFRGYELDSIARRVRTALAKSGLTNLGELQHRLLWSAEFFSGLLDDLVVQVSELFRDPEFYFAFRRDVVPMLRTYPELKIWLAGCAFGEEVYSLAILLHEEGLYERAQIYATDMSPSALARAGEGIYPESQAVEFADAYRRAGGAAHLEDYYSTGYGAIAFRESLKRNVVFFQHDLASDHALGEMHVIFCRNVLIYFASKLRDRVLRMFSDGLSRAGFLCLGSSECLPVGAESDFTEFAPKERIYRRRGEA
jgi:chemotaxis protein methyltransferase CheR